MRLSKKYGVYTVVIIAIFILIFWISLHTIHLLSGETSDILDISYEKDYLTNTDNVLRNLNRAIEQYVRTSPTRENIINVKESLIELETILKFSEDVKLNDEVEKTFRFASDDFDKFSAAIYEILTESKIVQNKEEIYGRWKKDYVERIMSETDKYRREDFEKLNYFYHNAKEVKDRASIILVITATAILVFLIISRFILSKVIIMPIKTIKDASKAIAKGNYSNRINISAKDELGILSGHINSMAEAIEDKIQKLNESIIKEQTIANEQISLKELMGHISSGKDINNVFNMFLFSTRELFNAEHGSIYILENTEEDGKEPDIKFSLDTFEGKTSPNWAALMLQGVLNNSLKTFLPTRINTSVDAVAQMNFDLKNMLAVPMSSIDKKILGLVVLVNREGGFTQKDEDRLLGYFSQAFQAIIIHQQIVKATTTDELTGLYNRRVFLEKLNDEIERAKKLSKTVSLLMIDIDNFREFNDKCGYRAGDNVLKIIARVLSRNIKTSDIIARYGSEEFIIMLPETTLQQASLVADRLLNRIKRDSFLCGESERIFVTVSIGYAACPDDADAGELLIKRAEQGVDIAKTKGKSRVCSYND